MLNVLAETYKNRKCNLACVIHLLYSLDHFTQGLYKILIAALIGATTNLESILMVRNSVRQFI